MPISESMIRCYPVVVGVAGQLRLPGDFITGNAIGQPILVARGTDGVLRAFLNVCRHRSASVETQACGTGKRAFVCPYHGWSYDLTGRLVGISDGAAFGAVDRAAYSLRPLAMAEKYGLVWVVPTALEDGQGTGLDIDAYLGPVAAELADWKGASWEIHAAMPVPAQLDRKRMVEAVLERYRLCLAQNGSVDAPLLDAIVSFDDLGPHLRATVARDGLTGVEKQPLDSWRLLDHAVVLYLLSPDTVLIYGKGRCDVFTTERQKS